MTSVVFPHTPSLDELIEFLDGQMHPSREWDVYISETLGANNLHMSRPKDTPHTSENRITYYGELTGEHLDNLDNIEAYHVRCPKWTSNVEDAMKLVDDGAGFGTDRYWIRDAEHAVWSAHIRHGGLPDDPARAYEVYDKSTMAFAIALAGLKEIQGEGRVSDPVMT